MGRKLIKNVAMFFLYLMMLILICIFFTGNGEFIYEMF